MKVEANKPTDYFSRDVSSLKKKKLFLFDMDGTIYEEDTVFNGTGQLLGFVRQTGGKYIFITNNSSKSVNDYVDKLKRLGIEADEDNFFTSSQATILYLGERYPEAKIYCQGTKSLIRELKSAGINVTEEAEEDVDLVLIGFDTEMTSLKLERTCRLLQKKDVPYIATNPDLRCPVNFGYIPDCGSLCQMIENTTGKSPVYIGKPEPTMIDIARKKLGFSREETVLLGDRLYTDIAAGLNAGVESICVLTGEATLDDIKGSGVKPTYVFRSVYDIWQALKALGE